MEIKSYKPDASLNISEKPSHEAHHLHESAPRTPEGHSQTTQTHKRSSVKKNAQDENKHLKQKTDEKIKQTKIQEVKNPDVPLKEVTGTKMQDLEDMIDALDPDFQKKKKAAEDLDFIFNQKAKISDPTPYHQDGNMEFYTKENESKREAIKADPLVKETLDKVLNLYQFDVNGRLTKQEYIKMHMKIARTVRKDLKEKGLTRLVEQDWKHDSKSKGIMERGELFDSLFELADVWTPDINLFQYVAFFQRLYQLLNGEIDTLGDVGAATKENPYNILG